MTDSERGNIETSRCHFPVDSLTSAVSSDTDPMIAGQCNCQEMAELLGQMETKDVAPAATPENPQSIPSLVAQSIPSLVAQGDLGTQS